MGEDQVQWLKDNYECQSPNNFGEDHDCFPNAVNLVWRKAGSAVSWLALSQR